MIKFLNEDSKGGKKTGQEELIIKGHEIIGVSGDCT